MPRILFPFKGLAESRANGDQPEGTTRLMRNARVMDPVTRRYTGASRAGLTAFTTSAMNAAPVKRIQQVVYNVTNQTYASLGDAGVLEWSKGGPTKGATKNVVTDAQSNVYALDGNSGLVKRNADGYQLWKIALPCEDGKHIVRALCIDEDTGFIYCGVSADGKPETARLWTYRQKDDNETELVEQIEPGGYIEALAVYQRELYALQNFPQRGRAYVQVYGAINSGVLEPGKQWEVPYPANDLAVSPKDGSVFVASDANTQRGLDPRSPWSTTSSEDWVLKNLSNADKRIWARFDARDRSSLALERISEESGDEGAEVIQWSDLSKHSRHWYANRGISAWPSVPDGESGPTYKSAGINGFPSLSFSGAAYDGAGTSSTAGQSMVGVAASSTDRSHRAEHRSPIPTYKGAQFALFMVFKAGMDEEIRGLLSLPTPTSSADRFRGISINRRDDNNLPGSIPMPGSVNLNEYDGSASDVGESTPQAGGPSGPNTVGLGSLSGSGLCILTWICDGGVHDGNTANGGTGTSTRSVFRVNGHPIDRWQSGAFSTTEAITLGLSYLGSSGHSRFAGEIGEMIVLSDWYDQNGVQQRLITCPTYPDSSWSANSDTEVERIEGYLAHKWGMAHELESGQAAWLTVTQPTNGETLTIGSVTYTFRTSLTAANDVLIGSTLRESGSNLYSAINRIGSPGVDYDQRTQKHPDFMAYAAIETNTSPITTLAIRSISPYSARVTLSASSSGNLTWTAANTQHTIAGSSTARGWYPHPFTLKKTTNSRGGPPADATNTQAQISAQYLLQSIYPMLSKWQPNTGRPTWVATSGYDVIASISSNKITTAATGLGGVGYGVRIGSEGQVFSTGPRRHPVIGDESILADLADVRKFGDAGASFVTSDGGFGDPWSAGGTGAGPFFSVNIVAGTWTNGTLTLTVTNPATAFAALSVNALAGQTLTVTGGTGAVTGTYTIASNTSSALVLTGTIGAGANGQTNITGYVAPSFASNAYPRMAVDEFDNLYVPIYYPSTLAGDAYSGVSLVAYRDASAGVAAGVEFIAYESLPNDQEAYAVAVDRKKPTFPTGDTVQHIEFVYLGTEPYTSDTEKLSLFKIRFISTTNADGSNRAFATLAVCGGDVCRIAMNAAPVVVTGGDYSAGGGMDALASYIDSCELFGKIYLTDGKVCKVYDPKTDTLSLFTSETAGLVPLRAQLLGSWRGRLILAGFKDNPHNWAASEKDRPTGWDLFPYTINDTQAVDGVNSPVGLSPDILTTFIPVTDDLSVWGGDHSIYRMTGDPATPGAQFHPISTTIGMAHGRSWCKDPEGRIYFFTNTGEVRVMDQAALGSISISDDRIPARLADIDLEDYRVEMAWSDSERALRVMIVTATDGGTHVESYTWERDTKAWSSDEYGPDDETDIQPSCVAMIDGDAPDDRRLLFGCEDGIVRYHDSAALSDDGEVIDSRVAFWPLVPEDSNSEWMLTDLEILTTRDQGGVNWYMHASDNPDDMGESRAHGFTGPGRAKLIKDRVRGAYIGFALGRASLTARWAIESIKCRLVEMGRKAAV